MKKKSRIFGMRQPNKKRGNKTKKILNKKWRVLIEKFRALLYNDNRNA